MASITVRNLDAELQQRLQHRAARHGRSPEEEVCDILRAALGPEAALEQETAPATGLGTAIHELFKPFGGVELDIPPREPMRAPSDQERC